MYIEDIIRLLTLSYFLFVFTLMVSDYKYWEYYLVFLYSQGSIAIHKLTGYLIPISGKSVLAQSKLIIQTIGSLGLLLCMGGIYKIKLAIRILFISGVFQVFIQSLPITTTYSKDPNTKILELLESIAILSSLLAIQ
jgi:hypothetical protein